MLFLSATASFASNSEATQEEDQNTLYYPFFNEMAESLSALGDQGFEYAGSLANQLADAGIVVVKALDIFSYYTDSVYYYTIKLATGEGEAIGEFLQSPDLLSTQGAIKAVVISQAGLIVISVPASAVMTTAMLGGAIMDLCSSLNVLAADAAIWTAEESIPTGVEAITLIAENLVERGLRNRVGADAAMLDV